MPRQPTLPSVPPTGGPLLLVTRPAAAGAAFLALCEDLAGRRLPAVLSPILELLPLAVAPGSPDALILTSREGAARAAALGLAGLPAWVVGPGTARAAREAGLRPVEAGPDAEALVARLLRERPAGDLLHLRGEVARGDVASRLRAAGLAAREAVAYRQAALSPTPEARAALDGAGPLVAPLFSPRSATLLGAWGPRAPLRVAAMSAAVAEAAGPLRPEALRVAARPDASAMARATLALLGSASPALEGAARPD